MLVKCELVYILKNFSTTKICNKMHTKVILFATIVVSKSKPMKLLEDQLSGTLKKHKQTWSKSKRQTQWTWSKNQSVVQVRGMVMMKNQRKSAQKLLIRRERQCVGAWMQTIIAIYNICVCVSKAMKKCENMANMCPHLQRTSKLGWFMGVED